MRLESVLPLAQFSGYPPDHFLEGGKSAAVQRVGDALAQAQARYASSQNRPANRVQSGPEAGALQPNCNQSEDLLKAEVG
jgi:hypothetical protein